MSTKEILLLVFMAVSIMFVVGIVTAAMDQGALLKQITVWELVKAAFVLGGFAICAALISMFAYWLTTKLFL